MPKTSASAPGRPLSFSTSRRWRRSMCAAAARARGKPRSSIRRRRWKASMPSPCPGGSAFGLDAASGVQAWLREQGRGFAVRTARVPIVPAAILFDLLNGGNKDWGRFPPYREFGYAAAAGAGLDFALGSVGAGTGATTVELQRRHRLGLGANVRRLHGRCARRRERRGQRPRSAPGRGSGRHRSKRTANSAAAAYRARFHRRCSNRA